MFTLLIAALTTVEWLEVLGKIVIALIIVLDPFALLPMLVGIHCNLSVKESRILALRVAGGAMVLLLFFTITGTWVLNLFAVTLGDLRMGGGVLLLVIALRMVIEGHIGKSGEAEYRAAYVPLISPLLVGPGAITTAVVYASSYGVLITSIAVIISMLLSFVVFLSARFIHRLIGEAGTELVTRILGVLIAAIGVSYIRTGIMLSIYHK